MATRGIFVVQVLCGVGDTFFCFYAYDMMICNEYWKPCICGDVRDKSTGSLGFCFIVFVGETGLLHSGKKICVVFY